MPALLDELVERQVHDVAALVADEHLRRVRIDCLHRLEVHPLANHRGRLRILRIDLLEAVGVAFGLRDHAIGVRLRFVDEFRGIALRLGQQVVRIGLRGTLGGLAVVARLRDFCVRGVRLLRRRDALHRDGRDLEPRLVAIEIALDRGGQLLAQRVAVLVQHVGRAARADDRAHRGLGGLRHAALGVDAAEQVIGCRTDPVLDDETHVDDVGVARQHRGFLHVRETHDVVAADLDRADLRRIDDLVRRERIRRAPVHALADRAGQLAELQHDARLAVLHDEQPAARVDRDQHADHDADADARGPAVVGPEAVAALAAEQAAQTPVEVAPHLVEIGRTVTVATGRTLRFVRTRTGCVVALAFTASPAGIVVRQQGAHPPPGTPLVVFVHQSLFTRWDASEPAGAGQRPCSEIVWSSCGSAGAPSSTPLGNVALERCSAEAISAIAARNVSRP
ncbi:conserved hypothetical protein [Burkholderia ambifaria MEX-5]|uniref:Uncharacterized protein n=1 Tax=Burkholderia ambifaria MEX-5 TaxID=396597 RepID=B1TCX5_9BURK|nr:conserved hypothetical protein [Burkholderia ambifaria MEX-5]